MDACGIAAYALIALGRSADVGALAWNRLGNELAAVIVLAAAAYQLTPLKEVCPRHCRGPFSFVLEHWRGGRAGALRRPSGGSGHRSEPAGSDVDAHRSP